MTDSDSVAGRWDSSYHAPVMVDEVVALFEGADEILDCTLGGGGHTEALEVVVAEVVKMGLPGLGRALRGQLHVQDGRPLRLNRDEDGLMTGKNLIAQIKHPCVRCHREGRRQSTTVVLAACAEIPHGVGLVVEVL